MNNNRTSVVHGAEGEVISHLICRRNRRVTNGRGMKESAFDRSVEGDRSIMVKEPLSVTEKTKEKR